ncbi:MAG: tRNA uridine-5-carboxymethylaminomethyl(34) synthesis GTPase MnmE [Chitinophagaceae bacterium]
MKLADWNDTIVALATAQGIAAIGVIRLSGKEAWQIATVLFPSKDLLHQASHTIHVGLLKQNGITLDEVVLSLFKGPKSYTGEDVVEISCHGSPFVQEQVIKACIVQGARLARAGEFTQRAFLNGKLDLTQAEAVADLIESNTSASQRSAMQNMRGGFSQVLRELRERILKFSALIELELDFAEEDVEFADRTQLKDLIDHAFFTVRDLLHSFRVGNVVKNGVQVAIIGKPNAGKSTLLNTLLNENRAIVSEIAGTTRDTVEELMNIDGIIFRLVDTAGIREHSSGSIESLGMEKSREKMAMSDLVVYLFDVNETSENDLLDMRNELEKNQRLYLMVGNKVDAASSVYPVSEELIFISAREKQGIDLLKKQLVSKVLGGELKHEDTLVTNLRHYQALQEVELALADVKTGMENQLPGDLLALDIRRSLQYIGEITGEITTEDKLDYIFSKFCIGK